MLRLLALPTVPYLTAMLAGASMASVVLQDPSIERATTPQTPNRRVPIRKIIPVCFIFLNFKSTPILEMSEF
jgi:hypothetical protein